MKNIHDMIHVDKSVDAAATGLSGSAVLPAFFGGKCAMTVQGNFQAQGMIQQSPSGFNWAMFPLLKGTSQNQVANPQTLSISQQSKYKKEAMQFIEYFANAANLAKLAAGDWLIPANPASGKLILKSTKRTGSWRIATSVGRPLPEGRTGCRSPTYAALEGGGRDAAVRAVPGGTRSRSTSWARTCRDGWNAGPVSRRRSAPAGGSRRPAGEPTDERREEMT